MVLAAPFGWPLRWEGGSPGPSGTGRAARPPSDCCWPSSLGTPATVCGHGLWILRHLTPRSLGAGPPGCAQADLVGRAPACPPRPRLWACAAPGVARTHGQCHGGAVAASTPRALCPRRREQPPAAIVWSGFGDPPPVDTTLARSRPWDSLSSRHWVRRRETLGSVKRLLPGDSGCGALSGLCQRRTWGLTQAVPRGQALALPSPVALFGNLSTGSSGFANAEARGTRGEAGSVAVSPPVSGQGHAEGELVFVTGWGRGGMAAPSSIAQSAAAAASTPSPSKSYVGGRSPPDGLGLATVPWGAWGWSRSYEISPVRPQQAWRRGRD